MLNLGLIVLEIVVMIYAAKCCLDGVKEYNFGEYREKPVRYVPLRSSERQNAKIFSIVFLILAFAMAVLLVIFHGALFLLLVGAVVIWWLASYRSAHDNYVSYMTRHLTK